MKPYLITFQLAVIVLALGCLPAHASESGGRTWPERITISGAVEMDASWNKAERTSSDMFVSKVEFGVEASIAEWITGRSVLLMENIGAKDEAPLVVDEATIAFEPVGKPYYYTFGLRTLPFGVFENHLVSDPLTQSAYETKRPGVTAGFRGGNGASELSLSVYKGAEMMDHLFSSGLFDAETVKRAGPDTEDVSSMIFNAAFTPVPHHLALSASYLSEPGKDRRNESFSIGINYNCLFIEGFRVDAEYIGALQRETYFDKSGADAGGFRDAALSLSLAYVFRGTDEKREPGGTYWVRRAHLLAEPVEIALRYETFDDGGMSAKTGAASVESVGSVGARCNFHVDGDTAAYMGVEYRAIRMRRAVDESAVLARLGVKF
ncbi:MAG: hypothetical protein HZA20_08565 [Nitrospirae bacterium]|nr:hypothetical protein [Nitrospirota bacterium]